MKVTASEVAKYIIAKFHESEDLITNMKVQKLLYYVQGWHLGLYGNPAFAEEFQAWVHGPVQNEVYQEYKNFQWNPINKAVKKPKFEQPLQDHIEDVLDCYGGDTAYALELITHKELPWLEARKGLAPEEKGNNSISTNIMKSYFSKLAEENKKNRNYELNKESIRILEKSRKGIGINKYSSWEEMVEKIEKEIAEESNG